MKERTNYGVLIISSLMDFQKTFPNMTFGEIMYSFLRQNELSGQTLRDIRKLSDEEIYQAIEESIKYEQEEPLKPEDLK